FLYFKPSSPLICLEIFLPNSCTVTTSSTRLCQITFSSRAVNYSMVFRTKTLIPVSSKVLSYFPLVYYFSSSYLSMLTTLCKFDFNFI
ncbi:hypothetical protein GE061_013001, partial [Apolygus lucorum]